MHIHPFIVRFLDRFKADVAKLTVPTPEVDLLFAGFHELKYKVWGRDHPFAQRDIGSYHDLARAIEKYAEDNLKNIVPENVGQLADYLERAARTIYWMGEDSTEFQRLAARARILEAIISGHRSARIIPHGKCEHAQIDVGRKAIEEEAESPRLPRHDCNLPGPTHGDLDDASAPGFCQCIYHFDRLDVSDPNDFITAQVLAIESARERLIQRRRETAARMIAEGWSEKSEGWSAEFIRRMESPK